MIRLLRSSDEIINNLINGGNVFSSLNTPSNSGSRLIYDYNPGETFSGADVTASGSLQYLHNNYSHSLLPLESINVVINYLRRSFDASESNEPADSKTSGTSLPVTRSSTEKSSNSSIALSNFVAVTNSNSSALKLVYPLEEVYRPRYKSDYFPQNGVVRRPRYIADNASNHFITLQIPVEYAHDLQNCYMRVALITQMIEGHGHYYSPYKFQRDHSDSRVPDENPTFIKVETSAEDNYTVRLQLVLIKSKLDHLNDVQPLQLFSDGPTPTQNIIHEEKLPPKDLITRYQLDKSHLAFTLCTKLPDGTYEPHPDTTVISSVITEASSKKTTVKSTAASNVDTTQNVCCPHCAHRFDPDTSSRSDPKPSSSKSSRSRSQTSTETRSNKKKKND